MASGSNIVEGFVTLGHDRGVPVPLRGGRRGLLALQEDRNPSVLPEHQQARDEWVGRAGPPTKTPSLSAVDEGMVV